MSIKIGDSFSFTGTAEIMDQAGASLDMTGWTVTAAGKIGSVDIAFTCVLVDGPKQTFSIVSDTSQWPVGVLQFDVRFTTPAGESKTTDPVSMSVARGYA